MLVNTITSTNCTPQTIVIGRRGTYDTIQIAFDLSYLIESYGSGTAVLAVKRSQDTSAYPAVVIQEDNTLTWTVSETDTYYVGSGECQLMWYVDGGLAKTIIYPMVVMRDILSTAEEPPDGYENWIEHLTDLGAETQQNVQNAAQSASEAEQAKDDAVDAKEASEEAARKAAEASVHAPIIQNGFWYIWSDDQYVNTNVRAEGEKGDKGDTGEKGDTGNGIASITKTGTSGLVDTYTVTYTDGTTTTFTVTNGAKGDKGDTGATGNGIQSITKTGTSGNVDTYTITYTNGQTTTFTVTNGAVTSVAGKTGAVVLDSGDIEYDSTETYTSGTVGAELGDLSRQLNDETTGLDTKAPVILETVSGAIASFSDGADSMPVRKLVAQIEPVQDLHGYDKPWPGGGGSNKWNPSSSTDGYIDSSGNEHGQSVGQEVYTDYISVSANTAYTVGNINYESVEEQWLSVAWYDENKTFISRPAATGVSAMSYNSPANAAFVRAGSRTYGRGLNGCYFAEGNNASYAPYSNECPISGHTGAEVTRTGKNLVDQSVTPHLINAYQLGGEPTARRGFVIKVPDGNYVLSAERKPEYTANAFLYINKVNADGTFNAFSYFVSGATQHADYNVTIENGQYILFYDAQAGTESWPTKFEYFDFWLTKGSTATDYEPYTGNQVSVNWQTEAGTVYGGTLTINPDRTGTLVVDCYAIDLGSLTWSNYQAENHRFNSNITSLPEMSNVWIDGQNICTIYRVVGTGPSNLQNGEIKRYNSGAYMFIYICDYNFSDASEVAAGLTDQLYVGKLVTPIEIPLTAEQVSGILSTLYGQNNVWANTGDVTVEYPADTKLFLTARDEEITGNIAPIENGTTASKAYAQGAYFWHDTKFCKALTAIASGATFTLGTNYQETTVAAELLAAQN